MGFRTTTKKMFAADETKRSAPQINAGQRMDVVVRMPVQFEDVQEYADALIGGNIVFLNLEKLDGADRNRVFDYMNGVAYIVKANVDVVSDYTLLLYAPANVTIDKREVVEENNFWG